MSILIFNSLVLNLDLKIKNMKILSLLFFVLSTFIALSQTFYVNSSSGNDNNDGSQANPFKSFTKAYNSLGSGNTETVNKIFVEGLFDWTNPEETGEGTSGFILNKNLRIEGVLDAQGSIFQPASSLSASTTRIFQVALGKTVIIDKCTMRYGNGTQGGAVENLGTLYIYNSTIINNKASGSGAGVDTKGFCRIENTQISYNLCYGSTGMGAGVNRNYYGPNNSTPNASHALILINCTITHNEITASTGYLDGGGVFYRQGVGSVTNCTITNNICSGGTGSSTHGLGTDGGTVQLKNNIIVNNATSNTWSGDVGTRSGQGTLVDNGGNIFGRLGYYPGNITLSNTSWTDAPNGSAVDGTFVKSGSTITGVLNLSSTLSSNGSNNGFSLATTLPSIALNNGVTGTNSVPSGQTVNIPNYDQRGITRDALPDIGAYENTDPNVSISGTLVNFLKCSGLASSAQELTLYGFYLTNDVTLTAPAGFEISNIGNNSGFQNSITFIQNSGTIPASSFWIRMTSSQAVNTSGNLSILSSGATVPTISLNGIIQGNITVTNTNLPAIFSSTVGSTATTLNYTANNVNAYQWYVNTTNSYVGGSAISGATAATYVPPTTVNDLGTEFYYCVATGCNTTQSGIATQHVFRNYYSKASATDFNDVASWGINTDGTGTAPAAIDNTGAFDIRNNSQMTLSANATVRALTINAGKLTVANNTLTISILNQNNTELNVTNGGTLEVTGGSIILNGAAYFANGSGLTQSGGLIVLYPSSGVGATSIGGVNSANIAFGIGYAAGSTNSSISTSANALKFNCTGGTIQIVDPAASTNAGVASFAFQASAGNHVTFGSNHTVKFGDGISTLAGGSVNGFLINTRVVSSGGYLTFGNFVVDALSGTNRLVINSGSTLMVTENLTVTSGEFRQNVPTFISGNLTNEGTYASQSGQLNFAKFVNGVESPATNAQIITGNGYFYNTSTSAPNLTNFSSISFNNTSAGGVTFASANSLKSTPSFLATLSAYLIIKNGVIHTGNNIFYSIQSNPVTYTSGGFGSGSTYARLYDNTYGGTAINAGAIPSFGRMSFPFVSGNPSSGLKARHFHRGTGAMSGFLVVKFTESPGLTALPQNYTESLVTYDLQTNTTWEVSTTGTITGTTNFCIQAEDAFPTGSSNVVIARNGAIVNNPSTGSSQPMGQRSGLTAANQVGTFTLATSSPALNYTWTGATSTDWGTASNWSPALVPNSANVTIPSSGITNFPEVAAVTIATGKTLTLQADSKLNVTGVLTNNGTMTIESGATLVQGTSSTLAGSGTYNVKQAITGDGTTTPTGRFWYLGSPVATSSSSVLFANTANVVKKRDEATNAWIALTNGTPENLSVGRGYYTQAMANSTVTFTGGDINNGTVNISNLTRTSGVNFEGFNLVTNPYPSYLDWDLVTKTNVGNTMWYRTATGNTAGAMVFETYVAGAAGGIGTNLSGNVATKLIPPMQAFWVRVNQGQTTGSIALDNSMRSHFSSISGSTAGLRSTNDELKVFLRMNLLQEEKKDQLIVYMNGAATNGFDILDGEKMMQAGTPQFYTKAGDKKIVINGLNSAKKQHSLPITMELPTTGVHTFEIENLELETGLVWLEDVQEGTMEAITEGYSYQFYGEAGINADRFVLHFNILDNSTPSAPNYGEVNSSANFSGKGASVHAEAAGVVVIKLPASTEGVTDIQIRDAAGRVVYTGSTNTLETSVKLEQANGIYYVTLNATSGVEVRKVFIQQ